MTIEHPCQHDKRDPVRYQLWPEDAPKDTNIPCIECELAKQSPRLVWGEGNPNASIWILLDNPGLREQPSGTPFVCGTRQTLQQMLHLVGFPTEALYVTFVVRRRPTRAYDKPAERALCMQNFGRQLKHAMPAFLMCLGDVAVQSVCTNAKASVKELRQKPWQLDSTRVYATYHPLAVRRRPNLMAVFETDWRRLYDDWMDDERRAHR